MGPFFFSSFQAIFLLFYMAELFKNPCYTCTASSTSHFQVLTLSSRVHLKRVFLIYLTGLWSDIEVTILKIYSGNWHPEPPYHTPPATRWKWRGPFLIAAFAPWDFNPYVPHEYAYGCGFTWSVMWWWRRPLRSCRQRIAIARRRLWPINGRLCCSSFALGGDIRCESVVRGLESSHL